MPDPAPTSPGSEPVRPNTAYALVHEFLVDFLGILLPGSLFTVVVGMVVLSAGACFLEASGHKLPGWGLTMLRRQFEPASIWFLLVIGYVVGSVFFRQDPKRPDEKSIAHILIETKKKDLSRSEVQIAISRIKGDDEENIGEQDAEKIANDSGAQFPYSHLSEYLEARGFGKLAEIVPWTGETYNSARSKIFINALKIRIQLAEPKKNVDIIRNEAHVRMMSSVWFAACLLDQVRNASIVVVTVACFIEVFRPNTPFPQDQELFHALLVYVSIVVFVYFASRWLKSHVESCFHYQRIREVFFVLETICYLKSSGHPNILDGLPTKEQTQKKFDEAHKAQCSSPEIPSIHQKLQR